MPPLPICQTIVWGVEKKKIITVKNREESGDSKIFENKNGTVNIALGQLN